MLNKYYIEEKSKSIDKAILFISIIMICIIPIIVFRYESIAYSPIEMNNIYGTGFKVDIFSFCKSIILYIGSISILSLFLYKIIYMKQQIAYNRVNIIIMVFTIFVILSLILSKYKDISILGNFDRNEGTLAWFCYAMIIFIISNINIDKKYFKLFYIALIPFLIINLLLALSNFYGYNVLKNDLIQFIIGGKGSIGGTLWTTLYHFNFMSGIAAVTFGVSFTYMLLEKDKKQKILALLVTIISFTIVLTSNSVGGFITSIAILLVILPIVWNFVDKKDLCIWSILTFILNGIIYFVLNSYNFIVYKETFELFDKINGVSKLIIPSLIVVYILALFIIKKVNNKKKLFKNTIILSTIIVSTSLLLYSYKLNTEDKLLEANNNVDIVRMSDSTIFKEINEMSTDRLNIWTKTINLINDKPIFGHGLDTFPYVFVPNDDNGGLSTYGELIDKPHNWYLSVAYGIGIIGLICLLSILLYIVKGVFYNCVDRVEDKYMYIYSIGCIAFAIQGMFNDSLVGTSIIFWIFAGLAVNRLHKIKEN